MRPNPGSNLITSEPPGILRNAEWRLSAVRCLPCQLPRFQNELCRSPRPSEAERPTDRAAGEWSRLQSKHSNSGAPLKELATRAIRFRHTANSFCDLYALHFRRGQTGEKDSPGLRRNDRLKPVSFALLLRTRIRLVTRFFQTTLFQDAFSYDRYLVNEELT
jgi:hypothetical protein